MLIVADENIPLLDSFFGDIGEIRRVNGRNLGPGDVRDADILLVRSVSRVNQSLLEGSRVRFVGTATIGTDHIDLAYLRDKGIGFAAAPGSNATSVAEYVLSVVSLYAEKCGLEDWTGLSVGVVGAGNVGGELARVLVRLGFKVKLCDPPRQDREPENADDFVGLDDILGCDVITLHTPLTRSGAHPTEKMIAREELSRLGEHQLLINSGRGEVIDGSALLERLQQPSAPTVVLDVWENEPGIDPALVERVWLATPHIAGYSLEGKMQGSEMIYKALCRFLGLPVRKQAGQFLPQAALSQLCFTSNAGQNESVEVALRACYDPRRDDARLRLTMRGDDAQRAEGFDRLRKEYPIRRECSSLKVQLKGSSKAIQDSFKALGFKLRM